MTVNRSGTSNYASSVTVKTTDQTAIADEDYQNISTVLNWNVGETESKTVTISILDNSIVNTNKTFQIDLINLVGDVAGSVSTAPFNSEEFVYYLGEFSGVSDVEQQNYGLTTFAFGTETITVLADYFVRRVAEFDDSMVGVSAAADADGDGIDNLKMTHSNGDEQCFFVR